MRIIRFLAAGAIALTLVACVPSVAPWYTADTLTFDGALVGVYGPPDSAERWVFRADGKARYHLTVTEPDGRIGTFVAHLLSLDGRRYLDLYPDDEASLRASDFHRAHFVATHLLLRVGEIGDRLELALMDNEWLEQHLAARPEALAHVSTGEERMLLTAPTAELQAFVIRHADEVFSDLEAIERIDTES